MSFKLLAVVLSAIVTMTNGERFFAMPGLFDSFRNEFYGTQYGPNKTPVTVDVLEAGFVYATLTVIISFLLILPGFKGKPAFTFAARAAFSIAIGSIIMICNFGQEWEVSEVTQAKLAYKAGSGAEVESDVGVHIGLRSVNITLKADNESIAETELNGETINYNERFYWASEPGWSQGRLGFGPFAFTFNQQFREGQFSGLPYPILWVAEYFIFDGEGIRWGRFYKQAGFYAHIMMWLAFVSWILANILLHMVISYGAMWLMAAGGFCLLANILYVSIRNSNQLVIPLAPPEKVLEFRWGWSFWLTLFTGIICVLVGLAIFVMHKLKPAVVLDFFGLDPLHEYEEVYQDTDEFSQQPQPPRRLNRDLIRRAMGIGTPASNGAVSDVEMNRTPEIVRRQRAEKSKDTIDNEDTSYLSIESQYQDASRFLVRKSIFGDEIRGPPKRPPKQRTANLPMPTLTVDESGVESDTGSIRSLKRT